MPKITMIGAGSTVFAKNLLGDCMSSPVLEDSHFALHDIDQKRLEQTAQIMEAISRSFGSKATITTHLDRREALNGADYVFNAIQVGGYKPATVIDFEIPSRYGLRQTIGDTLGIGGIFRGLRTIPVMLDIARDIQELCPKAWLLNYTNPMAIVTGAILRATDVKTVGLCHSVQCCVPELLKPLDIPVEGVKWKIAGINHMAWLLEITRNGEDLYPQIKKMAETRSKTDKHNDMVRYELMKRFGHYVTESSEHNAEYNPYFIKSSAPELIERLNIPLDEYPRRCEEYEHLWAGIEAALGGMLTEDMESQLMTLLDESTANEVKGLLQAWRKGDALPHTRSEEYASYMLEAMEAGAPYTFGGNVLNKGLITNLPEHAVVEVTCLADQNGITPTFAGALPPQLAALNQTNINVQDLTIEAALTQRREHIYHAAMLDPHTSSELTMDQIVNLCDDLINAHRDYLPEYK
ncbi:alpha-glucosidase/alpha-galactosidase [Endozoicomonas ascidiicola]|uniref:alpha-glucosidase/alpha-galactosidase n=1 Tax=Endozoicomonas ascidiicola TaxID=1698521 RepID=UPI00082DD889|nr:alpha-glucosidase/alpha-galactosidase [Endozoicomonas ascidiicola]